MDLARKVEVLDQQVTDAKNGHPEDFEGWRTATEVALRTVRERRARLWNPLTSQSPSTSARA